MTDSAAPPSTGKERRQHVRVRGNIEANAVFSADSGLEVATDPTRIEILNLSASGACLEADLPDSTVQRLLEVGGTAAIEVLLPEEDSPTRVIAKVVWATRTETRDQGQRETVRFFLGVRFMDLTTQAQDAIKQYIFHRFFDRPSRGR